MYFNRIAIRRHQKGGSILVLVVLCLTILLGITAIAVDGGFLLSRKQFVQATADAAALAAASTIVSGSTDGVDSNGKARQAALDMIENSNRRRDGLLLDLNEASVRISPQPPIKPSPTITDDEGHLLEGYVEVIVAFHQERYFSAIFGGDRLPIHGRAVARGRFRRDRDGIIVLDRDAPRSLHVHGVGGNITLNVSGADADVIVNSNVSESPGAASVEGGATVAAPGMTVTGVENSSGGGTWQIASPIVRNAPPTADPLRYLPEPNPALLGLATISGNGNYTATPSGTTITLQPGVYPFGLSLNGNSGPLAVTMQPGIYYIQDGGFKTAGQVNIVGTGVMIYNGSPPSQNAGQNNGISVNGGSTVYLTPLSSGNSNAAIYNGISIFSNRSVGGPVTLSGSTGTYIIGTIYAPNSDTMVSGNGNAVIGSRYISRTLDVGGSGTATIQYDPRQPPRDRILQLVQ